MTYEPGERVYRHARVAVAPGSKVMASTVRGGWIRYICEKKNGTSLYAIQWDRSHHFPDKLVPETEFYRSQEDVERAIAESVAKKEGCTVVGLAYVPSPPEVPADLTGKM